MKQAPEPTPVVDVPRSLVGCCSKEEHSAFRAPLLIPGHKHVLATDGRVIVQTRSDLVVESIRRLPLQLLQLWRQVQGRVLRVTPGQAWLERAKTVRQDELELHQGTGTLRQLPTDAPLQTLASCLSAPVEATVCVNVKDLQRVAAALLDGTDGQEVQLQVVKKNTCVVVRPAKNNGRVGVLLSTRQWV